VEEACLDRREVKKAEGKGENISYPDVSGYKIVRTAWRGDIQSSDGCQTMPQGNEKKKGRGKTEREELPN